AASASASTSWSWSYRSCSKHSTTCCPSFSARSSCRSLSSSEARIDRLLPQPHAERNAARAWSSSRRGPAGTGPSCSTSCQGSTAPPSAVWRSVFPALSPLVTCSGDGRTGAGRPRRLSRSHVSTINPYPGAGINQDGQAVVRRGVVLTLLTAAATGLLVALAGGPLPH